MKIENLVINTLVFINKIQNGVSQSLIMDALKDLDIKNIEIRREFLKNFDDELEDIRKKSEAYGMNIFYSVPEWLYKKK